MKTPKKKSGEPTNSEKLQALLDEAFPQFRNKNGDLSIFKLGMKFEVPPQTVYQWIRRGRVPPARAKKLIEISRGRLTLEKLEPFLLV